VALNLASRVTATGRYEQVSRDSNRSFAEYPRTWMFEQPVSKAKRPFDVTTIERPMFDQAVVRSGRPE
jgi:uncharacterized protein YijF (DUF1287 family)